MCSSDLEEYAAFWTAYQQDRDLLRFHYHRPREIWENLKDLDLSRRTFSSDLSQVPTVQHFITEDEIDTSMTGGSIWIILIPTQFICIGSKRPMVLIECAEESCSPISGKMITWNLSNKIR